MIKRFAEVNGNINIIIYYALCADYNAHIIMRNLQLIRH